MAFWDGGARKASVMRCFSRVSLARKKCWPEFVAIAGQFTRLMQKSMTSISASF